MKNYVPFGSSLKSIAYFSFFDVRNRKAVEGLFMFFPYQNLLLVLFYLMERRASETYDLLQASSDVLVNILINVRNNATFKVAVFPHSFNRICDIYLENSLLNIYYVFYIEKTIPVYIPTH